MKFTGILSDFFNLPNMAHSPGIHGGEDVPAFTCQPCGTPAMATRCSFHAQRKSLTHADIQSNVFRVATAWQLFSGTGKDKACLAPVANADSHRPTGACQLRDTGVCAKTLTSKVIRLYFHYEL